MDSVAQCVRELDVQTAELILASQNPSRSWVWQPLFETLVLGWWWAVGPGGSVSWKLGNSVFSKRICLRRIRQRIAKQGIWYSFLAPQTHAWCTWYMRGVHVSLLNTPETHPIPLPWTVALNSGSSTHWKFSNCQKFTSLRFLWQTCEYLDFALSYMDILQLLMPESCGSFVLNQSSTMVPTPGWDELFSLHFFFFCSYKTAVMWIS